MKKQAFDPVTGAVGANELATPESMGRALARLREMDPSGRAQRQSLGVMRTETPYAAGLMTGQGYRTDPRTAAADTWAYARKLHASGDVQGARQMFRDLQTRDPQGFQQQYAAYKAQRRAPAQRAAPGSSPQVAAVRQAAQKAKHVSISQGSIKGVLPGGQQYVGSAPKPQTPRPNPGTPQVAGGVPQLQPPAPLKLPGGVPGAS